MIIIPKSPLKVSVLNGKNEAKCNILHNWKISSLAIYDFSKYQMGLLLFYWKNIKIRDDSDIWIIQTVIIMGLKLKSMAHLMTLICLLDLQLDYRNDELIELLELRLGNPIVFVTFPLLYLEELALNKIHVSP